MHAGTLIAGRYELERELGEGGSATVWLARDRTLERPVAIKFLEFGEQRDLRQMTEQFLSEARTAAAVRHRNVIQILDFGVHQGTPFMAMEALDGESMADRFERGEGFTLREVVEIAARCLEGLAAVHRAGIVHRDLKPENIFLVREPTGHYPKLLDFGISKTVDKRTGRRSAVPTEPGRVVGTPEYMSPEQARGMTDLDARTDIYAMGVVMYEALTGVLPYEAPLVGDVLIKVVAGGAPEVVQRVPSVGRAISDVVARAMHRNRDQRFADAMQMRAALLEAARDVLADGADPISLPPAQSRERGLETELEGGDAPVPAELARAARAVYGGGGAGARRISPFAIVAALAGGAVLVAAAAFALGAFAPLRGAPEPRYIVVRGADPEPAAVSAVAAPARPGGTAVDPAAVPAAVQADEPVAAAPASTRRKARDETTAAEPRPAEGPGQELARAFERQKGEVVRCLNEHADQLAARVQLAVRLAIDQSGQVQAVELTPTALGETTIGACIAGAVRRMRFGPQPAPISMRVPLTARRSVAK